MHLLRLAASGQNNLASCWYNVYSHVTVSFLPNCKLNFIYTEIFEQTVHSNE